MIKAAFCITMYNEANVVQHNIDEIKKYYGDDSFVIVIQSDSGQKIDGADIFETLPNLGGTIDPYKLAAYSVTRNYNAAFRLLYSHVSNLRYIVALTGDTYISDITGIERLESNLYNSRKLICVSQAIGQNFHASDDCPPDKVEGRHQYDGITDFMPQFFLIKGTFAYVPKIFSNIEVTNPYCTEQCLGDELSKHMVTPFNIGAYIMAKNAYDYNDGIIYNYND